MVPSTTFLIDEIGSLPQELFLISLRGQLNQWGFFKKSKFGLINNDIQKHLGLCDISRRESIICELWMKSSIQHHLMRMLSDSIDTDGSTNKEIGKHKSFPIGHTTIQNPGVVNVETVIIAILQIVLDLLLFLKVDNIADMLQFDDERSYPRLLVESSVSFLSRSFDFLTTQGFWLDSKNSFTHFNLMHTQDTNFCTCNELAKMAVSLRNKSISVKMLDYVSFVSKQSNSTVDNLAKIYWDQFCDMSFEMDMEDIIKLPFSFGFLTSQQCSRTNSKLQSDPNTESIYQNLLKSVMSLPLDNTNDIAIQHLLLAHWAEARLNGLNIYREYVVLIDCLRLLLSQLASDVMVTTKSKDHTQSTQSGSTVQIKCLSVRTIPLAYEIALILCTSSLCLDQSYLRENLHSNVQDSKKFNSTLNCSVALIEIIFSLIELYKMNFVLFPERILGVTTRLSFTLLKAFESDIDACIGRKVGNSQSPRKKAIQSAFHRMKPFFDSIHSFANVLKEFLEFISELTANDEVLKETSVSNRKAISSLETKCESILTSIQDLNVMYNHNLPSALEILTPFGTTNEKILIKDRAEVKESDEQHEVFIENINIMDEDEDSDSFGVTGDWGDDERVSMSELQFIEGT